MATEPIASAIGALHALRDRALGMPARRRVDRPVTTAMRRSKETVRTDRMMEIDGVRRTLAREQMAVFDRVVHGGESIYLTGGAGTGKTHTMRAMIEAMCIKYGNKADKAVGVTASTGVASTHYDRATTLHSFAGISQNSGDPRADATAVSRAIKWRWRRCRVLFIDEVSMLPGDMIDYLYVFTKHLLIDGEDVDPKWTTWRRRRIGGLHGIQVVMAGDMAQLPPVSAMRRDNAFAREYVTRMLQAAKQLPPRAPTTPRAALHGPLSKLVYGTATQTPADTPGTTRTPESEIVAHLDVAPVPYAFDAQHWRSIVCAEVELREVHRQRGDNGFIDMLTMMRRGVYTGRMEHALEACRSKDSMTPGSTREAAPADIPHLFATRREVHAFNRRIFESMPGESVLFEAHDKGRDIRFLDRETTIPRTLCLKVGSSVMLLRNIDVPAGLVNGMRGVVMSFRGEGKERMPVVRFDSIGVTMTVKPITFELCNNQATRVQLPLMLAHAMTVHKAQGMSFDRVAVSFESMFTTGQAYVAVSRARSLRGLYVCGLVRERGMRSDRRVVEWHRRVFASHTVLEDCGHAAAWMDCDGDREGGWDDDDAYLSYVHEAASELLGGR